MISPDKNIEPAVHGDRGTKIIHARTICRPVGELYAFCRDLSNLALISKEAVTLTPLSKTRFGFTSAKNDDFKFTVRVINDRIDDLIAWKAEDHGAFHYAGTIRFKPAPGDEGTEVTVTIEYEATGGKFGGALAKAMHQGPGAHVAETLRRFKAFMEAGEIPTIEGQPVGEPQKSKTK